MKVKVVKSPSFPSSQQGGVYTKPESHRRRKRCLPYGLRVSLLVWVCLLLAITYVLLSFMEMDAFRTALKNVKLRSSSRQHDHEDTTNSGPHDLHEDKAVPDVIDLPLDDIPTVQPLVEPPQFDSSLADVESETPNVLPPQVLEILLKEPTFPRVAFVDTPLEERIRMVRTKRPVVEEVKYQEIKETENGTKYSLFAEGLRKWDMSNISLEWKSNGNTTSGVNAAPPSPEITIVENAPQPNISSTLSNISASVPVKKEATHPKKPLYFGYSVETSKTINLHRAIPDGRHESCKKKQYSGMISKATVIISVYNEEWNVLLRTIHSLMERTPAGLLHEVIIVDDHSDSDLTYMGEELSDYVKKHWENVNFYKNEKREGLIWSRMDAATSKALGNVLVFLDSHVEVNHGWLEPLLERIEKNWQTIAVPVLDTIAPQTFQYTPKAPIPKNVDGFNWDFYTIKVVAPKPAEGEAGALATPITGHGQFAIAKRFFNMLGGLDSRMVLFGGENLEMSLKAWMCGGRVEIVPCSRVGHVDRGRLPSLRTAEVETKIKKNLLRVSKVWLEEHSIFHENSKKSLKSLDYGDVTGRIQLKTGLNCKSFSWYLKNVYPQMYDPKGKIIADSDMRSLGMDGTLCLDALSTVSSVAKLFPCHGDGGNQRWWYTTKGEIRRYDQCLDYWGKKIQFFPCHGQQGNQFWLYLNDIHKLKHVNTDKCMTVVAHDTVEMESCEENRLDQQWIMSNFNTTAYDEIGFGN